MAKPEPDIFDEFEDEADRQAMAEADADIAAGRVVPHERVVEWLKSLGTPNQLPTPYSWRK
ncbi:MULTISPECIES: antitoxin [Caulobacter]|jgi:predicted transcriptional regulator|uniref:antitoxin n=1 Tax=Caulobacter TaxID=75 RepID=UPI0005554D60|nr:MULTISPECIES: antitoxin [Caulobacter]MBQ1561117.1 antitoxin [Caulobacter sp.]